LSVDNKIKEDEIGWACSRSGRDKKYNTLGNLKGINNSEDLGVDGRIILGWISGK
jgi:hypothetical protein